MWENGRRIQSSRGLYPRLARLSVAPESIPRFDASATVISSKTPPVESGGRITDDRRKFVVSRDYLEKSFAARTSAPPTGNVPSRP